MEFYGHKISRLKNFEKFKEYIYKSNDRFFEENKNLYGNETFNLIVIEKMTKTESDGFVYSENTLEKSIQSKNLDSLIEQAHKFLCSYKDKVSNYCFDTDNNYNIRFSFDLEMEKDEIYHYNRETEFCLFITKTEFI